MAEAVAARYGRALVDLVVPPRPELTSEAAVAELRLFEQLWDESPDLRNILMSPAVPAARKRAVVSSLAERAGLSRLIRNFLFVVIDHRRIGLLRSIREAFEKLLDERLGVVRVQVSAAQDLSESQRRALTDTLSSVAGRQARLEFATDPSLLGGVVARIGSTIYDGSVRGQLDALRRRLAAD
jgi:F-type H+-transporting ATPase subunit delta